MTQRDLPGVIPEGNAYIGWVRQFGEKARNRTWQVGASAMTWGDCWDRLRDHMRMVGAKCQEGMVLLAGQLPHNEPDEVTATAPVAPISGAARAFLEMTGEKAHS